MSTISSLTWAANDSVSEHDLLEQFALQTDLARENQLNAEYLAGGSQVLYGETLRRKGLQTVGEALSRLPGVQPLVTNLGKVMTVRGNVIDILQSDIQVQLNGIDLVAVNEFQPYFIYSMPLDTVARIELIKGPGSARYGEYSQGGVINVVTTEHQPDTMVVTGAGPNHSWHAGAHKNWAMGDWSLDLSLSARRWEGTEAFIEQDASSIWPTAQAEASKAPGKTDDRSYFDGVILRLESGETRFDLSYLSALEGDHWGALGWLSSNDHYKREYDVYSFQAQQGFKFGDDYLTVQLGGQRYNLLLNNLAFVDVSMGDVLSPSPEKRDIYQDNFAVIQRSYGSLAWQIGGFEFHDLLAELRFQYLDVRDAGTFVNVDIERYMQGNLVLLDRPRETQGREFTHWLFDGVNESVLTLALEDRIHLGEQCQTVLGLRYDSRGNALSPRVALLYELSSSQRVSMQLAKSLRTPTLNQEAINPELDNESSVLLDISYRYESDNLSASVGAYASKVKDKISPERALNPGLSYAAFARSTPVNDAQTRIYKGIETRFDYQYGAYELELALSYMNGDGSEFQRSENFVSPWSADLGFTYHVNDWLSTYIEQRFLSERARVSGDSREDFSSQSETNLTLAISPLSSDELLVTLNVRNVFDRDRRAPSGWLRADDFPEDFPLGGREVHASVAFRW